MKKIALKVNKGISQQSTINKNAIKNFRIKKKSYLNSNYYFEKILKGDLVALSQSITLVESSLEKHHKIAQEIIEKCLTYNKNKSLRIGITGVPGVGKSTFIESLGEKITKNKKLAVLAIDPSSENSKGSVLGDKTRMHNLANDKNAFIRPSPSGGSLGGVANKTRETIILCETFGFDIIFVETVGVGQSETAVNSMVDFFLLLILANAGDELQGIKRGIMEMADVIVITKDDGKNKKIINIAKSEYKNALHLFPIKKSKWTPKVLSCSALKKTGINEVIQTILDYEKFTKKNNFFEKKRKLQLINWMYENINFSLKKNFYNNKSIKEKIKFLENEIINMRISPFIASKILLKKYFL